MELSQEWRDLVASLDLSTNLLEIIGKIEKPAAGADFSDFFYTPRLKNSKLKKKTLIHNHISINLLERFWLLFGLLNTHKSLTVQYGHKTKEDLIFRKDFQNSKYVK